MVDTNQVNLIHFPGGVADPETPCGFVTNMINAIEALDLDSGQSLWRTTIDARPVGTLEGSVLALTTAPSKQNELQIIALDKTNGAVEREVAKIIFPDWVVATITPDDSFNYQVTAEKGELVIRWEAQARYRGGAAPSNRMVAQLPGSAGIARVNVKSGEVRVSEGSSEPIELPADVRDAIAFPYQRGASSVWHNEPWAFNGQFAIIVGTVSDDQQTLSLRKWQANGDRMSSAIPLVTGPALVSYVASDGLFVFVHSEIADDPNHPWWVFSVTTGEEIATLSHEDGARESCVLGPRIYYLIENPPPSQRTGGQMLALKLKAVDIPSGAVLWESLLSERPTRAAPSLRQ